MSRRKNPNWAQMIESLNDTHLMLNTYQVEVLKAALLRELDFKLINLNQIEQRIVTANELVKTAGIAAQEYWIGKVNKAYEERKALNDNIQVLRDLVLALT